MLWGLPRAVVLHVLLPHAGEGEARAAACACREARALLGPATARWTRRRWSEIHAKFPPAVLDLMGGARAVLRLPRLAWSSCFLGPTGYLDGILPQDMSAPVMIGCDIYGRAFVAFRFLYGPQATRRSVAVLFQRSGGVRDTWSSAQVGLSFVCEPGYFLAVGTIVHELLAFNVCNLLEGRGYVFQHKGMKGEDLCRVPCRLV